MKTFAKKIKYGLCPGYVVSKNDNQEHYITSRKLIQLYNVDPNECIVFGLGRPKLLEEMGVDIDNLILLTPKHDGNYII